MEYEQMWYQPFTGTDVRPNPSRSDFQAAGRSPLSRAGPTTVSAQIGLEQRRATAGVVLPVRRGKCERAKTVRRSCELALLGGGETSRRFGIGRRVAHSAQSYAAADVHRPGRCG